MARSLRMIGLSAATLPLLAMAGCYEHVVHEKGGFGQSRTTIHEANVKDERIPIVDDVEDAIFGKRQPIKK